MLHVVGPEASSVIQRLDKMFLQSLQWSPDRHHLLIYGHCESGRPKLRLLGVLAVINVALDQVLACSDITRH